MASFMIGIIPVLQFALPMGLYYGHFKKKLEKWNAEGSNYERAWMTIMWGMLAAYGPAALMWVPAYFSKGALEWFKVTQKYAAQTGPIIMTIVGALIATDLLASKKGDGWIKHELVFALLYTEI